ncbi:MAG TPA: protein translocase subunit SecD, partial [Pirellulaceae bacterium]|nr:protein translocase subunit SecD [Pirellulaceae bacterium]
MAHGMIEGGWLVLAQNAAAVSDIPWYRTAWGGLLILAGIIAAAVLLARMIANGLRLAEYQQRLSVIIGALTLGLVILSLGWPPRLGVDLRGGINFIGQLNLEMLKDHSTSGGVAITASDIIPRLLRRVDPGGTKDVQIRPVGNDRIEVTIPDVDDQEADEIWSRLVKTGLLQFRIVCDLRFHARIMDLARKMADEGNVGRNVFEVNARGEQTLVARWYNLAREEDEGQTRISPDAPFKYVPRSSALVRDRATGRIIDIQNFPGAGDKREGALFSDWLKRQDVRSPQILVLEPTRELLNVEGKHLTNVRPEIDEYAAPCVRFDLTPEGSRRMYQLTSEFKPDGDSKYQLGIILDDSLHTAPEILEPISSQGRITGRFTSREVDDLKRNLESGRLEVALHKEPISRTYQASTLGIELREKGFYAIAISLAVVLAFMVFYYRVFCGGVACLVLIANIVLVLAWVIAIRQPLSLTGLAGLVLTVGMAVDANVLIFERIREELIKGASLRMAIRNGFDRATTTIIDANVTTLITAIVLYGFGTEQIKGFSITLILGILMGMFTAVYCARTVFEIAERKKWITQLSMMQIVTGKKIDFLGKRRVAFAASGLLIIVGLISMFSLGGELFDIDLRGGSTARIVFKNETPVDDVRSTLANLNLKHNDRQVDFLVTSLMDKDHPERSFKIDSSLPSYEEGQGERWKQLDEVLEEAFAGRLVTREVELVGERTIKKLQNREWQPFSM